MFAMDRSCRFPARGLARPRVLPRVLASLRELERLLAPARWLALAVAVAVALRLAGPAGGDAVMALAGTASLLYLAMAATAGGRLVALLDLAALAASGLALAAGVGPSSLMMVHVLWGALRMSLPAGRGERRFAAAWSTFFAASALLLGLSA